MAKDKSDRKPARRKRQPKVKIPLPFGQAIKGLLALSPEDAKAAREAANKRK
jgi:hypothetical protein